MFQLTKEILTQISIMSTAFLKNQRKNMRILLIGDECIDKFVYGTVTRINPESPTPIFDATGKITENKGMVGNVEANLKSLSNNKAEIIKCSNVMRPVKERFIDEKSGQILLRVDHKVPAEKFDKEVFDKIIERNGIDAVVVSDYDKGYLSYKNIEYILSYAKNHNIPSFIDTKKQIGNNFNDATFIKINKSEHEAQQDKRCSINCENYIYTDGSNGCYVTSYGKGRYREHFDGHNVEVSCVSGAGDTVLAALVISYLEDNKNIENAIKFSMKAAAAAVKHRNVVAVTREEADSIK